MEELISFIIQEALILIPALIVLGKMLKDTPNVKDWLIPYILLACGVIGTVAILGLTASAVIQGVLVAGASVYLHQIYKQTKDLD